MRPDEALALVGLEMRLDSTLLQVDQITLVELNGDTFVLTRVPLHSVFRG